MVNKVRTIDFLPEIFKTHTNRQFLNATLDVVADQPNLRRVQGFIGEKYGYGVESNDKYVVEPTKARRDYQLDPGVIFLKPDTQNAQDFINYSGILNSLKHEGGSTVNQQRLFENEFYSWDPFADYDKIVNYAQYYWLPNGPDAVPITKNIVYDTGEYIVSNDDNGYQFAGVVGVNPGITLLRGGTYTFQIPAGSANFWIQKVPGIDATASQRTIPGTTNNGTNNGTVTFTVPSTGTLVDTKLWYQNESDPNSVGIINLIESNSLYDIDIADILDKKTYVSPNGIIFINGLKIEFGSYVTPSTYKNKQYYVEGVGTAIKLLPVTNFIAGEITGEAIYNPWDITPWDIDTWDAQLYVPVSPEYITIERNSRDYNAWTRSNRWFHKDVIDTTTNVLGYATMATSNTITRAQRPIIEYRGNLKLYNSGIVSLGPVNIVDTTINDAFTDVEGKTPVQVGLIDGLYLSQGQRIIFTADNDPAVRKNVYFVTLVPAVIPGTDVINLVEDNTVIVRGGAQVFVLAIEGSSQSGTTWYFDSPSNQWISGQKKIILNQYPLFDIFNDDGISLGNTLYYSGTTFDGTKLLSYTVGDGPDDPVLGFPIAYSNPDTIGDILFTVNLNSDTFTYGLNQTDVVSNINIGFVNHYIEETVVENLSGWVTAAGPSFQHQVFEFPAIDTLTYSSDNVSIIIDQPGTGYAVGNKLKILGNLMGGTTPENDLYFTISTVAAGGITGILDSSINGNSIDINEIFYGVDITTITGNGSAAQATVVISGVGTTAFKCDVLSKLNPDEISWNPIVVYYGDNVLDSNQYSVYRDTVEHTTTVRVPSDIGTKVTILIISSDVSSIAYYQTPSNLENNPFNTNITNVAVGDIRNQYRTIFSNAPGVTGLVFGNNNLNNLGNLNKYGTSIIQNSASLVLPGLFLRKQEANIFNAIQFNSEQYEIYKALLVDLTQASDYSVYTPANSILDDIIYKISTTKNSSSAFFWSDMVFSGNPYVVNTYEFAEDITTAIFGLSTDVWTDTMFSTANYSGIAVYLTRIVSGKEVVTQLLKNQNYTISSTPNTPSLTVNYNILSGDTITVKEYNQTYGSYCPNTPSKLGLYPIFVPEIVQPPLTNEYFIMGHDGSLNKLYGSFNLLTGALDDFRDQVLFEFEKRVYNNYKVSGDIPLVADEVIPGQFRTTEYTRDEILSIYGTSFLNWIGSNRLNYKSQYYSQSNKFSYNYNQSTNKLTNSNILQGYWRGIYNWFYDTDNPAYSPWEMLGLTNKPSWWDSHYGPAPYTSGNTYMWQDISNGYVWNNGDPYINTARIRPELLSVLPVDSYGIIQSPFTTVMSNYDKLTFNREWAVGDGSPVESSYLKSSAWPFDLMRLLALTKPVKFFNLFVDRDKYKYNDVLLTPGQYLFNERYHLDSRAIEVYGDGTAKHSYINWVVDYNNNFGANGTKVVTTLLKNLDVRLVYNMAGFTAKNYLKFLIEKATPNSKNTSLLVPDENYSILLYDNPPEELVMYSAVIVQKIRNGWAVWGNSKNKNFFTTAVPKTGLFKNIIVDGNTVQVSTDFYDGRQDTIPYGTVFYSTQAVCQFLQNYGAYLITQGVQFTNIIEGVEFNWQRMSQEFLMWAQQGWDIGAIISLNPNARNFVINREGLVPQPLTLQGENFLLNQNLLPIQNQDMCIDRENERMEIKILSPGDTVAYGNVNLNSIEHAVVFDNSTSFNDTIYNLTTGLRQARLLLKGYKSGDWNGYINASGFILNENNIKEWQPNTKYPKNIIVISKNKYYSAKKLIEPQMEFSVEDWMETEYGQIKSGLLPNPSTTAYEAQFYYDTDRANLENDVDLLAFSLIGFRPRDYLTAVDLSDITQINVYKNIVKTKGTKILAESFKGAEFAQGRIDYNIQENWAIKYGSFGAILNSNFVEARLNQTSLTGNPTLIGFAQQNQTVDGVQQTVYITGLVNYERPPVTENFLPLKNGSYTLENGIPSAGYVNLNDSTFQAYYFENLNDDILYAADLYRNDVVWIANHKNSWNIYVAVSLENQIIGVENNLNNTVTVFFENFHNLLPNDLIVINNFDYRVDGYYTVKSVESLSTIIIELILDVAIGAISGLSTGLKLVSSRFEQASDAADNVIPYTQWTPRRAWVDYSENSQWAVYQAGNAYKESTHTLNSSSYGTSVAYSETIGKLVANGTGNIYRYYSTSSVQLITGSGVGVNTQIKIAGNYVFCSSPTQNLVYIYEYNSVNDILDPYAIINPTSITPYVTGAIAVSSDASWLYIADATTQQIAIYAKDPLNGIFQNVSTYVSGVPLYSGWGTSIATSTDGVKFVVGAPYEDVSTVTDAGAAYVYTRRVEKFYGDGTTFTFTLADAAPNNVGIVYVNDVVLTNTYSISGTIVTAMVQDPTNSTLLIPPPAGSVITVSTGYATFVQRFQSDNLHIGGWFGNSVDTNRYGAEIVVGAPYNIVQLDNVQGVEGSVYRYTNAGQRYGVITTTITGSLSGTIFVDGYKVVYSGTITAIRDAINNQTPTNIVATSSGNTLTITVKEDTPEVVNNIIDITGSYSTLVDLGIISYTNTQTLKNFDKNLTGAFGYTVKMNERDSLLVSAINKNKTSPTTFDFKSYCRIGNTIFDNDTTIFIDTFEQQGMVYLYDYLPAYNEGISNPGKYAFGQYISTNNIVNGTPSPRFGYSLSYSDNLIIVGTPYWNSTQGGISVFSTGVAPTYECDVNSSTSWFIDKVPLPVVDINSISNINIYSSINNETLEYLDYIDPLQGKLLGATATNINFMSSVDPAVYGENGVAWSWNHLGETWLDLRTIRLLNYHQPDVSYNAKHWGKAFPGSTADIYTWIESTTPPINYNGNGIPLNFADYTAAISMDNSSNNLVTKYYYWVKNYSELPLGKTLSPFILSTYLLNPLNSGIGYLAPITTNIVGLYNSSEYIQTNTSVLHLGYGLTNSLDDKHSSWSLIREDDAEDFLSGLPTILGNQPTGLYLKFIESFSGFDADNNQVPDPRLPNLVKYGTYFRPRQSMFIDRLLALENYITYANSVLISLPIAEIRNLSLLELNGLTYDTRNYWTYVNWWESGYSNATKPILEVNNYNDLQTIAENELLVSISGTNIFLENGLIVKVKENRYGNSEYYIYDDTNASNVWKRIGAENGTIQISAKLYSLYGWSTEPWDNVWDKNPSQEITNIIRWLNEQCYINELDIEKNRSLILMFKFIQSESQQQNNYLPWLNKTSLIDVNHRVRGLLPYKKYQRDDQEFLEGFFNEIKPYHVLIKNFVVFSYDGLDDYYGNITDFDLPAQYNTATSQFQTPQLVYGTPTQPSQYLPSNVIWSDVNYKQWYENTGVSINNAERKSYPITILINSISATATTLIVKNIHGFPTIGNITIGTEIINYNSINIATSTLNGLTRGIDGTLPSTHISGEIIYIDVPSAIVYNGGRGYTNPPKITAYIDTSIYPAPVTPAILEPVMAGDSLIAINVVDGGNGYATAPTIIIGGSSIVNTFTSGSINTAANTITISGHTFITGDSVVYSVSTGGTAPPGLINGSYYWVRSINANTIALYESYIDATMAISSPYLHVSTSDGRVDLVAAGIGSNHKLTVTARAWCYTSDLPIREMSITLKFDRLSYTYTQGAGSATGRILQYYEPTFSMPGKILPQLMSGTDYPGAIFLEEQFTDRWDYSPYDPLTIGWDGVINNPIVDTNLTSPSFTSAIINDFDVEGNEFLDNYSPEELVGGYVWDSLVITVQTNDSLNWTHTIEIDRYGAARVYSNSGNELLDAYYTRWWYGTLWFNPTTDPAANTTMSVNTHPAATFLRS